MNALKERIDKILGLEGTIFETIGRPSQAAIEYLLPNGVKILELGIYERGDGRWYIGAIHAPVSSFLFRELGG
jgi:hypothetical protein